MPDAPSRRLAGGNRQALPALLPAALENDAPVFSAHPDPEAVSPAAAAAIWLKRALHALQTPGLGATPGKETKIVAASKRCVNSAGCRASAVMVDSPAFGAERPRGAEFSTPVEKPVEISSFWRIDLITR